MKVLQHHMVAWNGAGPVQGTVLVGDGGLAACRQVDVQNWHVQKGVPFWGTVSAEHVDVTVQASAA